MFDGILDYNYLDSINLFELIDMKKDMFNYIDKYSLYRPDDNFIIEFNRFSSYISSRILLEKENIIYE